MTYQSFMLFLCFLNLFHFYHLAFTIINFLVGIDDLIWGDRFLLYVKMEM